MSKLSQHLLEQYELPDPEDVSFTVSEDVFTVVCRSDREKKWKKSEVVQNMEIRQTGE